MHITIIGTGAGARLLAKALVREHHDVEFLIHRGKRQKKALRDFHAQFFEEEEDVLAMDFSKTDGFVFCDDSNRALVLASLLSNRGIPIHFISYDSALGRLLEKTKDTFGIDTVYDYGSILAARIHRFFFEEEGMQTEIFENFDSAMVKIDVGDNPAFAGRRVKNIGPFEELVLVTIRRGGKIIVPKGNTVIEANDVLRIVGSVEAIRRFRRRYGDKMPFEGLAKKRRFLIFGDGKSAESIEETLAREADTLLLSRERRFPYGVNVVIDRPVTEVMDNIDLASYDGFVAASEDDADNFLLATAARDGGQRAIALCLKDESYMRVVDVAHTGGIFSGELLVSQQIKNHLFGPPEISLHLFPGSLEIYEILLNEDVYAVGKSIEELDLPEGFLIGGIEREGKSVLAKGRTVLRDGDRLILFLLPECAADLQKFIRRKPKRLLTELFSM
ncbi:MAG: TrkA C-terminal domain-containing protein [Peptoniphilus sp.]|nr:TrkA C-terminal domain-containing protein [Peptoniphilus sp.]MDY3118156.1 TrkA C-terminal domain-containing protein [Peptoniphilus sp.]